MRIAFTALLLIVCVILGCSVSRSVVTVEVKHTEAGVLEERDGVRVTVEIGAHPTTQTALQKGVK